MSLKKRVLEGFSVFQKFWAEWIKYKSGSDDSLKSMNSASDSAVVAQPRECPSQQALRNLLIPTGSPHCRDAAKSSAGCDSITMLQHWPLETERERKLDTAPEKEPAGAARGSCRGSHSVPVPGQWQGYVEALRIRRFFLENASATTKK